MSYEQLLLKRKSWLNTVRFQDKNEGQFIDFGEILEVDEIYSFIRARGFDGIRIFNTKTVLAESLTGIINLDLTRYNKKTEYQRQCILCHELAHEYYRHSPLCTFVLETFCLFEKIYNMAICNKELCGNEESAIKTKKLWLEKKREFDKANHDFILFVERFADARACSESTLNCLGTIANSTDDGRVVPSTHEIPSDRRKMARTFLEIHFCDSYEKNRSLRINKAMRELDEDKC